MKVFPDNTWAEWSIRSEEIRTSDYIFRLQLLEDFENQIKNHTEEIFAALTQDLGKPRTEALLTEIAPVIQEINFMKKHLKSWMQPQKVKQPMSLIGTSNWIQFEGKGKVLILSPWNYPYRLAMNPVVAAIASGNSVCLKASEHSSATTNVIYKIIAASKLSKYTKCFSGGPETAQELLALPFDHIFFTGGTEIGRQVMKKAAENLTPVTLELGGKSPTFILPDADLKTSLERILWGKFMNAGQTCVAPDYVLLAESKLPEFLEVAKKILIQYYGEDASNSSSYARIIHKKHTETIAAGVDEVKNNIVYGGKYNIMNKYIEPTLVLNPPKTSKLMSGEIFGPVLPVITYKTLDEAIGFVKSYDKPLALYVFTNEKTNFDKITRSISSGAALMNTVTTHLANPYLPFGGVGSSGIGRYHGKFGFEELSHMRAFQKIPKLSALKSFFPPYEKLEKKLEKWKEVLYKL